jgi:hypothetical protein
LRETLAGFRASNPQRLTPFGFQGLRLIGQQAEFFIPIVPHLQSGFRLLAGEKDQGQFRMSYQIIQSAILRWQIKIIDSTTAI